MLPFGEAWTGSLIHRRSDTLWLSAGYDAETKMKNPWEINRDSLIWIGAPHFGSADRPREAQIRLPGFALPGDLVE